MGRRSFILTIGATVAALTGLPGAWAAGPAFAEPGAAAPTQPGAAAPAQAGDAAPAQAGDAASAAPSYAHGITRLDGAPPPHIDGRLDEEAWLAAVPIDRFIQRDPDEGAPASERTEARLLCDDAAIYVAIHAFDREPERIVGLLTRRDGASASDWLTISFDSFGDRRSAFDFEVNAAGVKRDIYRFNDTGEDASWDAVWEAAARITADGWCAEYRIPFSQLRFAAAAERPWGIQIVRIIARKNEIDLWKPIPKDSDRWVSEYGSLGGIAGVEPPHRIEFLPYTVAGSDIHPAAEGDPFTDGRDLWGRVGLDLKYGIASNVTLDGTVNPDFGQVEADPSVLNISEFETFFPEKRPFFLEGTDKFLYGLTTGDGQSEPLFYTRRIGRAPQGGADGEYVDYPGATTILGAAKISGKTGGGVTLGAIEAITQEEVARVEKADGSRDEVVVEPFTNYAVARFARDFRAGETALGGIATATNRRLGGTDLDWLPAAAYTGGADIRHRIDDRGWAVNGKAAASYVSGSSDAMLVLQESSRRYFQRPDASHVEVDPSRTSLAGGFGLIECGKFAGTWRGAVTGQVRSPGFEINDLGYQRRADEVSGTLWIGHRQFTPGRLLRSSSLNWNANYRTNFGGEKLALGGNMNAYAELASYWSAWAGAQYDDESLHLTALRGGPAMIRPPAYNVWTGFESDSRHSVYATLDTWWWHQPAGSTWSTGGELSFYFRIASNLNIAVGQNYELLHDDWAYVGEEEAIDSPQYLMARLVQQTLGLTTRVNWTFMPEMSLELYASPYLSAGSYADHRRVVAPRAERYRDRFDYFGDPGGDRLTLADGTYYVDIDDDETDDLSYADPDFSFGQFRASAVLRWEYMPGSTVFLVYQHDRTDQTGDGEFHPVDDASALLAADGTHTVLLKVSYWWSP